MSAAVLRWLREPLLHFLLIGLLLFAAYDLRQRGRAPEEESRRIELTAADLQQIGLAWVAQGRPAPTPDELRSLVEARVREEILYREARALGLDVDDTIVRRRLAQKMEFLFEDVAALREPTQEELRAWFQENAERFTLPPRATFRHLYFSPDRRGERARDEAASALREIAAESDSTRAKAQGDPFMFQDHYGDRASDDVARAFGPGFAEALFRLEPGAWAGPIESGYGWHLVWLDALTRARVPAFEEVSRDVLTEWTEEQRAQIREKAFLAMRARYEVVLPDELPAIAAPPSPGLAAQ